MVSDGDFGRIIQSNPIRIILNLILLERIIVQFMNTLCWQTPSLSGFSSDNKYQVTFL